MNKFELCQKFKAFETILSVCVNRAQFVFYFKKLSNLVGKERELINKVKI